MFRFPSCVHYFIRFSKCHLFTSIVWLVTTVYTCPDANYKTILLQFHFVRDISSNSVPEQRTNKVLQEWKQTYYTRKQANSTKISHFDSKLISQQKKPWLSACHPRMIVQNEVLYKQTDNRFHNARYKEHGASQMKWRNKPNSMGKTNFTTMLMWDHPRHPLFSSAHSLPWGAVWFSKDPKGEEFHTTNLDI